MSYISPLILHEQQTLFKFKHTHTHIHIGFEGKLSDVFISQLSNKSSPSDRLSSGTIGGDIDTAASFLASYPLTYETLSLKKKEGGGGSGGKNSSASAAANVRGSRFDQWKSLCEEARQSIRRREESDQLTLLKVTGNLIESGQRAGGDDELELTMWYTSSSSKSSPAAATNSPNSGSGGKVCFHLWEFCKESSAETLPPPSLGYTRKQWAQLSAQLAQDNHNNKAAAEVFDESLDKLSVVDSHVCISILPASNEAESVNATPLTTTAATTTTTSTTTTAATTTAPPSPFPTPSNTPSAIDPFDKASTKRVKQQQNGCGFDIEEEMSSKAVPSADVSSEATPEVSTTTTAASTAAAADDDSAVVVGDDKGQASIDATSMFCVMWYRGEEYVAKEADTIVPVSTGALLVSSISLPPS
jgi:hypothetical protein